MSKAKHEKKVAKPKGLRMSIGGVKNKKYGFVKKTGFVSLGALLAAAKAELSRPAVHEVILCK